MVWAQFAAYHVDRCEAVARRLAGKGSLLAVEVATTSRDYAWEPSGDVTGARKVTLFPGRSFDEVKWFSRLRAMFRELRKCETVFVGLGYAERDVVLVSWLLRLTGRKVVVFTESKFDDRPRRILTELVKAAALLAYNAAIVGGKRHHDYMRFLGFRNRRVLPGYDGVSLERVRREGESASAGTPWADRAFLFVGRFVEKKNLLVLIEAYARYSAAAGDASRPLILAGGGPLEPAMRAAVAQRGLSDKVRFPGFLPADAVSRAMGKALCLVLPSAEEQWGLVVNEALAFNLPVIVSDAVGSRDCLVRGLENGFVIEPGSPEGFAAAMLTLGHQPDTWQRMVEASSAKAWMADTERLADAIELVLDPETEPARTRMNAFCKELELEYR